MNLQIALYNGYRPSSADNSGGTKIVRYGPTLRHPCRFRWKRKLVDPFAPMANRTSSVDIKIKSTICTSPLYRKEWWLRKKYLEEKLSAREIAVLAGHSHHAVNSALKRFGLVRAPSKTGRMGFEARRGPEGRRIPVRQKALIKWMIRMHEKGLSYRDIARRLEEKGIKSPAGKDKWYGHTVRLILIRNRPLK